MKHGIFVITAVVVCAVVVYLLGTADGKNNQGRQFVGEYTCEHLDQVDSCDALAEISTLNFTLRMEKGKLVMQVGEMTFYTALSADGRVIGWIDITNPSILPVLKNAKAFYNYIYVKQEKQTGKYMGFMGSLLYHNHRDFCQSYAFISCKRR